MSPKCVVAALGIGNFRTVRLQQGRKDRRFRLWGGFTAATKIFCFVADLRGPDSHKFVSLFSSDRRKFGSQPSDSINGWKSRGGKSQRRERVSRKKIRKEKESEERRCETLFFHVFPMFCGPGEPKSRLAEAAGAEPSAEKR